MVTSRRKRTREKREVTSCPICNMVFPSARNMDLYDHEEMIIKHVTSCSSNQSSSSSSRNRRPSRYTKGQNDNLFLSIVSHSVRKETSDKLVANPLPIESLQDRQCSIVSHDSEDQPARKNTPFQQIKQVIAAEDSIEKNLLFSSTESNEENTFIRTPPHASSKLGEDSPAPLERCPVCFLQFQRQPNVDDAYHYQMVLDHINKCSRNATVFPEKPLSTSSESSEKLDIIPKKLNMETPENSNVENPSTSRVTEAKLKSYTFEKLQIETPNTKQKVREVKKTFHGPKQTPTVITDPRHFLAQTWWRKPEAQKRQRRGKGTVKRLPVAEFDIQQCLVKDSKGLHNDAATIEEKKVEDECNLKTRASKRRKAVGATLDLRCPICGEKFVPSTSLGSLTEEDMSRHVKKCSRKMFNSKTRLKANRQINTNSAKNGAHAIRSPVLPFSPEEKKQYQDALESHVRSFGEILKLNTDEKIPRMCQLDISLCTVDFGKVKS